MNVFIVIIGIVFLILLVFIVFSAGYKLAVNNFMTVIIGALDASDLTNEQKVRLLDLMMDRLDDLNEGKCWIQG